MYQLSHSISGYRCAIWRPKSRNLPSVVLTIFAFVTTVTLVLPVRFAWAKAASIIRSDPWLVITRKSMPKSSVTLIPWLPSAYISSVFSRKKVQSMFSAGTRTGRTLANRSSALRIETFALSILGHPSPCSGVCVGPFSVTWHSLISSSTSSGIDCIFAARFSMVSPSITLNWTFPLLTGSRRRYSSTRWVSALIVGPMPSPPSMPTMIGEIAL